MSTSLRSSTRCTGAARPGEAFAAVDRAEAAPDVPALLPVVGSDVRVPLVDGRRVRYANLDYAASAPALRAVADTLESVLPYYASVHRGAGYLSQVSTALYEEARAALGAFVGARGDDVTVITRNTTDALNLLASAVPEVDGAPGEVVSFDLEHHANLLPWRAGTHRLLPVEATLAATLAALETELARRPAALVAVTGCSNVTGEIVPVEQVVAIAHRHGARVVVDAAQLAPHRPFSLADTGADYVAFSGHKLYAPYGAGVLVGRRDWLDAAPPHLAGGGAVVAVSSESTAWAPAPQRHEGGTPNVLGAVAAAAACSALGRTSAAALQRHEAALTERLLDGLATLDGVTVLRIWEDSTERAGVIGFTVAGHDPGRLAAALSAEYGVGVRDGKFCAHPLLARLGVAGGALRASLGVGSTSADVDRLVGALERLLLDGEQVEYALRDGRWAPAVDTRPAPSFLDAAAWTKQGATGVSPCAAGTPAVD